jgi:hypothetical protein
LVIFTYQQPAIWFPKLSIAHPFSSLKSRGLTAWLWLFKTAGQAKAAKKLSSWLGLAWPILAWLGQAHGLKLGQAQH